MIIVYLRYDLPGENGSVKSENNSKSRHRSETSSILYDPPEGIS